MDARLLLELRDDVRVEVVAPAVDVERFIPLLFLLGQAVAASREEGRHETQEQQ